jgi:hypothetical protein
MESKTMTTETKPTRAEAEAKSKYHGASRCFDGYDEAVTGLRHLRADWGAAAMYRNSEGPQRVSDTYTVYAWYDRAGRIASGREA